MKIICSFCNGKGKVEEEIYVQKAKIRNKWSKDTILVTFTAPGESKIKYRFNRKKLSDIAMEFLRISHLGDSPTLTPSQRRDRLLKNKTKPV